MGTTPIQVVGIGLDGASGLATGVQQLVEQATLLVGSARHLSYFPHHPAERLSLGDLHQVIQIIRQRLLTAEPRIVILASGDPLFFGLGRLLLTELPPDLITFHPHLSAVQLAFSRVKLPWQDARMISAHGRSLEELTQALQRGESLIAVLTDAVNTPTAIAQLLLSLDLPNQYQIWVCENLGGNDEQVRSFTPEQLLDQCFEPLNVVILQSSSAVPELDTATLPALGLADCLFLSFSDRPGLMTKREVRLLIVGELALQQNQIIWDIGAGTGSVAIEIARLFPESQVYAIEKTAVGTALIQRNSQRFQVKNVAPVSGTAPDILDSLPAPDRIFIGGSGGQLAQILDVCQARLNPGGNIVLALATLEHLNAVLSWTATQNQNSDRWTYNLLQVQLSRSVAVGSLTRLSPLNPVTLVTLHASTLA